MSRVITEAIIDDLATRTIEWAGDRDQSASVGIWGEIGGAVWSRRFKLTEWCAAMDSSTYVWYTHVEPRLRERGVPAVSINRFGTRLGPDHAGGWYASKRASMAETYGTNTSKRCFKALEDTPYYVSSLRWIGNGGSVVKLMRHMAGLPVPKATEALLLTVGGDVSLNPAALVDGLR